MDVINNPLSHWQEVITLSALVAVGLQVGKHASVVAGNWISSAAVKLIESIKNKGSA